MKNLNGTYEDGMIHFFCGKIFLRLFHLPCLVLVAGVLIFATLAEASSGITYHGRILKPSGQPVLSNVQFRLQIRSPGTEDCLLYEEIQSQDLSTTNGLFSLSIGDGTGVRQDLHHSWDLFESLSNRKAFSFSGGDCTSVGTYTPAPADNRKFRVFFNDGTFGGWEALPLQTLNFIPMSIETYAVGGFPASSLLRVETAGVLGTPDPMTSTEYSELLALIGGTSTQYSGVNELNGSALPLIGSGQSVRWTGSAWEAYTPPTNASLPTCTAGQVLFSNGSALSCVADGGGGGAIDGDDITSGTIGGTTAWNTSGNIQTSGTITATGAITGGSLSGSAVSTRDLRVYESTNTNYVSIQAPAGLTPNYTLTLPTNDGGSGDVLSTNGSGVLSWIDPSSSNFNLSNIRSTINPLNPVFPSSACTTSQTLRYDSSTDTYQCSDVEVASSGLPDEVILDGGNTTGATVVVGTADNQHFQIQTNGTAKMTVLSGGNVGIGTSNPTAPLDVVQTANASGWTGQLTNTGTGNANSGLLVTAGSAVTNNGHLILLRSQDEVERFTVKPNGYVGIGTASPLNPLHVVGTNNTGTIVGDYYGDSTTAAGIAFRKARGTASAPTAVQNGDFLAAIGGRGYGTTGFSSFSRGTFLIQATENWTDTAQGAALAFQTTDNGTTNKFERMRINHDGNVGIGTTNPLGRVHVSDGQPVSASLVTTDRHLISQEGASAGNAIVVAGDAVGYRPVFKGTRARGTLSAPLAPNANDQVLSFLGAVYDGTQVQATAVVDFIVDGPVSAGVAPQRISFITSETDGASRTEKMTIKASGKVGIGTTDPASTLSVAGSVQISYAGEPCSTAGHEGIIRYNGGSLQYCDGSSWQTLGVSGSGLTSLNGQTGNTQTFAVGTSGNAPAFSSASDTHTLNIPMASASGAVTAGLLSNAEYVTLNSKLGAVTGSALASNQVWIGNGSNQAAVRYLGLGDIRTSLGAQQIPTACTSAQTMTWSALTDVLSCTDISIASTQVAGMDTTYFKQGGNSFSGAATLGTNDGNDLNFETNGSARMTILANGNIGIGTVNPSSPLQIVGTNVAPTTTTNGQAIHNRFTGGTSNIGRSLYAGMFVQDDTATVRNYTGELLGITGEVYMGYDSLGGVVNWNGSANLVRGVKGYISNSSSGTGLIVSAEGLSASVTNPGSGAIRSAYGLKVGTVRATGSDVTSPHNAYGVYVGNNIQASGGSTNNAYAFFADGTVPSYFGGNVGIGTTTPANSLHVNFDSGSVISTQALFSGGVTDGDKNQIMIGNSATSYNATVVGHSFASASTNDFGYIGLVGKEEAIVFNKDGNVGIGTNNPTTKLEVAGIVKASGFEGPLTSTSTSVGAGTNSAPSMTFSGDPNTGFYNASSNDTISVATGGTNIFNFTSNGLTSPTTGGALIKTGNGDATTPTFSFSGDPDTGWFRPAADTMAASTAGTERIRINSNGNIGIGTTSSANRLFVDSGLTTAVSETGATMRVGTGNVGIYTGVVNLSPWPVWQQVFDSGFPGTYRPLSLQPLGGGVGIGTTSPGRLLQVTGDSASQNLGIEITDTNIGGAGATFTPNFGGTGIPGLGAKVGFPLRIGANGASNHLTIDTTGNVGIGTTNPAQKLHVNGVVRADTAFYVGTAMGTSMGDDNLIRPTSNNAFLNIKGGGGKAKITLGNDVVQITSGDADSIRFTNGATSSTNPGTEVMRLAGGNVGIGTTSPQWPLHIASAGGEEGFPGIFVQDPTTSNAYGGSFYYDDRSGVNAVKMASMDNNVETGYIALDRMTGRVGIGTTNPIEKFQLSGGEILVKSGASINDSVHNGIKFTTDNDPYFSAIRAYRGSTSLRMGLSFFTADNAVPAEQMRLSPAGYLGIGTTNPSAKLDIVDSGSTLTNNYITRYSSSGLQYGGGITVRRAEGTAASPSAVLAGGTLGGLYGIGYGATGWGITHTAAIRFNAAENWTDSAQGTSIDFATTPQGSTTRSVRMTISDAGNVGIGTTNPISKLTVSGTGGHASGITIEETDAGADQKRLKIFSDAGVVKFSGWDDTNLSATWSFLSLSQSTGNVGIGNSNPSQKLHVMGNIFVDSTYDCTMGNASGSVSCSSDERLKENVKTIPQALRKVLNLRGVEFDWNEKSNAHGRHDIGVIAQEVEKEFPSMVHESQQTGMKMVDYGSLVSPLIQALKEFYALWFSDKESQDRAIASLRVEKAERSETEKLRIENVQLKRELTDLKSRLENIEEMLKARSAND